MQNRTLYFLQNYINIFNKRKTKTNKEKFRFFFLFYKLFANQQIMTCCNLKKEIIQEVAKRHLQCVRF